MNQAITLSPSAAVCHLPPTFALESDGGARGAWLAYEIQGPSGAPVRLALGGVSANRHVLASPEDPRPGWWQALGARNGPLDAERYRILGVDWLGGSGGSWPGEGPADIDAILPLDQARGIVHLLDHLGLDQVETVLGASLGGMVALALAAECPRRVGRVVAIGSAGHSEALTIALRILQREILALDSRRGLAVARALALTTYVGAEGFARRFGAGAGSGRDNLEAIRHWLLSHGTRFAETFPPASLRVLSAGMDHHMVDPARILAPVFLIALQGDRLVPEAQVASLAARLPRCLGHEVVATPFGHDAFLKTPEALLPALERALGAKGGP